MSDSTDRIYGRAEESPKPSHAENFAKKSASGSGVNHGKLGQAVIFINAEKEVHSGFFKSIQGMSCHKRNKLLRVYLIHSIIDISTSDAIEMMQLIYNKKYAEFRAGGDYDGVQLLDISFHDVGNLPPIP